MNELSSSQEKRSIIFRACSNGFHPSPVRFGVGGFLPESNHAVIGESDFAYKHAESIRFVTEMKTGQTFSRNEPWYRQSKAQLETNGTDTPNH